MLNKLWWRKEQHWKLFYSMVHIKWDSLNIINIYDDLWMNICNHNIFYIMKGFLKYRGRQEVFYWFDLCVHIICIWWNNNLMTYFDRVRQICKFQTITLLGWRRSVLFLWKSAAVSKFMPIVVVVFVTHWSKTLDKIRNIVGTI